MANRHDDDAREPVRQFRLTRHATVKRLCRVNAALSTWDEHDAALARPDVAHADNVHLSPRRQSSPALDLCSRCR